MFVDLITRVVTLGLFICLGQALPAQANPLPQDPPPKQQQDGTNPNLSISQLLQKAQALTADRKFQQAVAPLKQAVELEPKATRLWMQLANSQFIAGKFKDCIASYDRVTALSPTSRPHLWQRGLALYYADQFQLGKEQFETHQEVNSADVENSVWHLLCAAKVDGLKTARKNMIPIEGDARIPMAEVLKMFAGKLEPADVLASARETSDATDRRKHEYYAFLYIGLFQEMMGQPENARKSLAEAVQLNPYSPDVLMGQVARVHLELRDRKSKNGSGR